MAEVIDKDTTRVAHFNALLVDNSESVEEDSADRRPAVMRIRLNAATIPKHAHVGDVDQPRAALVG